VRRKTDVKRLARALIELEYQQAQKEAEAEAEVQAKRSKSARKNRRQGGPEAVE
jgi:hypothetical protein